MTPLSETVKQSIEIFFGSYSEPRSENFLDAEECVDGDSAHGGNKREYTCQKDVIYSHSVILTLLYGLSRGGCLYLCSNYVFHFQKLKKMEEEGRSVPCLKPGFFPTGRRPR